MRIAPRIRQVSMAAILVSGQTVFADSTRLDAVPVCEINDLGVFAQTIVDVERRNSSGPSELSPVRYFLRVECLRQTDDCEVARLNLLNIEAGEPIGLLDLVLLKNMRLDIVQERVATITRPPAFAGVPISPGITIKIDLDKMRLEYSSSGELGQSIGVGPCAEFPAADQPQS